MKRKTTSFAVLPLLAALAPAVWSCGDSPSETPAPPVTEEEQTPDAPFVPADGCGLWNDFAAGRSELLPDFSYAGCAWGEKPLPEADYPVFNICDYGAVADDGKSDRKAFEAAVSAATAENRRGAVIYVPAGRFELHDASDPNTPIIIDGDNIVLRGAGRDRSVLAMSAPGQVLDESLWNTPELLSFRYLRARGDEQLLLTEITAPASSGSHEIEVASSSGVSVGQRVLVKLAGDRRKEAVAAELAPHPVDAEFSNLAEEGVQVAEYHSVKRVNGTRVTLYEPLGHDIDPRGGWTLHAVLDRSGCGVEDLRFEGAFTDAFAHHKDPLHDSGWRMLTFLRQAHGWVRRCAFANVSEALSVMLSCNITVEDCVVEGNAGHSAVRSQASTNILVRDVADCSGQYHSIGVSKTASHTVLLRCEIGASSSFEAHCSQPRNTLIDQCRGGLNPDHAGGDAALGPNHLRGLVIWNYTQESGIAGEFPLWKRNNRFVMPVIAGFVGTATFDPSETSALESLGARVEPQSLYEAQLRLRLGR